MEFHEMPDGSAIVHGIAVAPFVPLQHMQVDISALNLLGNYCFRFARERGWLQTSEELAQATPYAESNDARPLIENEGHAYLGAENTFFFAGVEEALANPHPHFHYPPTPSTLFVCAHFRLVHVGNSSYGIFCTLHTYLDGAENKMQHVLGTFKVTTVWVSKVKRTPAQLAPSKQALFKSILARAGSTAGGAEVRVQRLSVPDLLASCGWCVDGASLSSSSPQLRTLAEAARLPEFQVALPGRTSPQSMLFRRLFTLRETDIDFNLHVNQLVSKLFVINTFRAAVARPECAYSLLLRPGEQPIRSDLLLRKFRIDYVREIPMRYAGVGVFLFPVSATRAKEQFDAAARVPKTAADSTAGVSVDGEAVPMMEIGFFTVGVPTLQEDDSSTLPPVAEERFIATVGVMTVAACFLPLTVRAEAGKQ